MAHWIKDILVKAVNVKGTERLLLEFSWMKKYSGLHASS